MATASSLLHGRCTALQLLQAAAPRFGRLAHRNATLSSFLPGLRGRLLATKPERHYGIITAVAGRQTAPLCATLAQQRHDIHRNRRAISSIGAEPGIDPAIRSAKLDQDASGDTTASDIRIIDYSDQRFVQNEVASTSLGSFLETQTKPEWAACRWIYVNGLNWDVVKCLGKHKRLHRLAIEDVLDTGGSAKVDWYDGHCFMEVTLQKLVWLSSPSQETNELQRGPKSTISPSELVNEKTTKRPGKHRNQWRTLSPKRFGVSVEQVSIFLTTDNTVITIFEHSGADILQPILTRLQSPQTVVRSSNDPSMLVQAVLDAVVDLTVPIAKAVGDAYSELELAVLSTPTIEQSKQLYVLRSGLTLLMDNIVATGGLVKVLIDHRSLPETTISVMSKSHPQKAPIQTVTISPLTQVYLQDVQDHIRTISNSTHMSIRSAEHLTGLIFNIIAASQNESVRQLTLVSCFFLPLTFLTGYFGMNFDPMPVVNQHSDAFFWIIATPVMLATIALLVRSRSRRRRAP